MTKFTTRMMIAAATLVVAAGAASAQTMKAEIPFTFRAGPGGTVMEPGTYNVTRITRQSTPPLFRLSEVDARHPILLMPGAAGDAKKAWQAAGKAVLYFECTANNCALAAIWEGADAPAYEIRKPKMGKDEPVRVALVEMRAEKSE